MGKLNKELYEIELSENYTAALLNHCFNNYYLCIPDKKCVDIVNNHFEYYIENGIWEEVYNLALELGWEENEEEMYEFINYTNNGEITFLFHIIMYVKYGEEWMYFSDGITDLDHDYVYKKKESKYIKCEKYYQENGIILQEDLDLDLDEFVEKEEFMTQ